MDKELKDEWTKALDSLMGLDSHKRKHFALLVVSLARCYTDNVTNKAVVLIENEDALLTFSVGADEMDAAVMIQKANEALNIAVTADAPAKEMFN